MKAGLVPFSTFGIGSVPYVEGKNSCEEIFRRFDIPFWPQYPARSLREKMVFQFLSSFPGLSVSENHVSFDEALYENQIEPYRARLQQAFSENNFFFFEPPEAWALGYAQMKALLETTSRPDKQVVKLQVTGPAAVWNAFFSNRVSSKNARQVFDDLSHCLTASGLAQIQRFHSLGVFALILIDEPFPGDNLGALKKMIHRFKKETALSGLHVCSNAKWPNLEELEMDFFHFDCSICQELDEPQELFLQSLVKKGGWIGWGIIPTSDDFEFKVPDRASILLNWLRRIWGESFSTEELLEHSLLAPACGTGTLTREADQKVTQCLIQTAEELKNLYFLS